MMRKRSGSRAEDRTGYGVGDRTRHRVQYIDIGSKTGQKICRGFKWRIRWDA